MQAWLFWARLMKEWDCFGEALTLFTEKYQQKNAILVIQLNYLRMHYRRAKDIELIWDLASTQNSNQAKYCIDEMSTKWPPWDHLTLIEAELTPI